MPSRLRPHLTFANLTALIALFIALGSGAYAVGLKKNSVKSKHIANGQVRTADVRDDGLTGADVLESSLNLPPGPQGPQGPAGQQGPAGSPDTPAQVRDKLASVDGSGSGIDADTLDGLDSGGFVVVRASGSFTSDPPSMTAGACFTASQPLAEDLTADDFTVAYGIGASSFVDVRPRSVDPLTDTVNVGVCNTGPATVDEPSVTIEYLVLDN